MSLRVSTGGIASLLKDSEVKFNEEEKRLICCILSTSEYCQETTQQVNIFVLSFVSVFSYSFGFGFVCLLSLCYYKPPLKLFFYNFSG